MRYGNPRALRFSMGPDALFQGLRDNMIEQMPLFAEQIHSLFARHEAAIKQKIIDRAVAVYSADFLADVTQIVQRLAAERRGSRRKNPSRQCRNCGGNHAANQCIY